MRRARNLTSARASSTRTWPPHYTAPSPAVFPALRRLTIPVSGCPPVEPLLFACNGLAKLAALEELQVVLGDAPSLALLPEPYGIDEVLREAEEHAAAPAMRLPPFLRRLQIDARISTFALRPEMEPAASFLALVRIVALLVRGARPGLRELWIRLLFVDNPEAAGLGAIRPEALRASLGLAGAGVDTGAGALPPPWAAPALDACPSLRSVTVDAACTHAAAGVFNIASGGPPPPLELIPLSSADR
eukprot:tig00000492_g1387.t1